MKRVWTLLLTLVLAGTLAACGDDPPAAAAAENEPPTIAVTTWTGKTELFMEHPPLVAGEQARFAIHLTDIATFKPIREGRVVVRFEGETIERFAVDGPSTPGIFGVDVKVPAARRYQIVVELHGALSDEHRVGAATVYPDQKTAVEAEATEEEAAIAFLKEQQWTLDFATTQVDDQVRRAIINVPATIEPRAGGSAEVRSSVSGRIATATPRAIGTRVSRGDTLVQVVARNERAGEGPVLKRAGAEVLLVHRAPVGGEAAPAHADLGARGGGAVQRHPADHHRPALRLLRAVPLHHCGRAR